MKKIVLIAMIGLALSAFGQNSNKIEKKGFLATKWCVKNDMFADCRLETYHCGYEGCYKDWLPGDKNRGEIVLYVHDEGKIYNIKLSGVHMSELLDKAANRNEVTLIGNLSKDKKTIIVKDFKAPPPPKKSFFKGCL